MKHTYWLGADGHEYFTREDAEKIGHGSSTNGTLKKTTRDSEKVYETVYDDVVEDSLGSDSVIKEKEIEAQAASVAANSLALSEFDNMDAPKLREILRTKGFVIRGNPSRETLLAKLKGQTV